MQHSKEYESWLDSLPVLPLELRAEIEVSHAMGEKADTSRGMAELFEDRPSSPALGIFTAVFCEQFCDKFSGYAWRAI